LYGDLLLARPAPTGVKENCKVQGCERPQKSRQLCMMHYARLRKNGDPEVRSVNAHTKPTECSIAGCDKHPFGAGLCHTHYRKSSGQRACSVEGCGRRHEARGLCEMHYERLRIHGDPLRGRPNRLNVGDRFVGPEGYVRLVVGKGEFCADSAGIAREHRYLMAKEIGRDLLPSENVHHINGVRDDNDLSNLELWSSSQPSGQRIEDKVEWARQILETYGHLFPAKASLRVA
jgi:hypothetical protein